MFCYAPMYRPPQFSTLPKGWELIETPQDRSGFNRPDLPTSQHRFGVIGFTWQLSADEREQYELRYLGDFVCMKCTEARIDGLEKAVGAALQWFENEPGTPKDSAVVVQLRAVLDPEKESSL